jgi:hypothetical protein
LIELEKMKIQLRPILFWLYHWSQFRDELNSKSTGSHMIQSAFQSLDGKYTLSDDLCVNTFEAQLLIDSFSHVRITYLCVDCRLYTV